MRKPDKIDFAGFTNIFGLENSKMNMSNSESFLSKAGLAEANFLWGASVNSER